VLGIPHPLAISDGTDPDVRPEGAFSMRGHSVGGYGSVTTNKVIAAISGDLFGMDAQAYPKYGSEKKGLPTTYFLTLAEDRIRMHSELNVVDFIPLNNESAFLTGGNPLTGLREGGTIFIQSTGETPEEVWARVPTYGKRIIREKKARVLALDAARIAREVATDPDLEVRMQGIVLLGIFLKATPFSQRKGISREDVMQGVEKSLRKYFGKRGEQVVQDNLTCVRRGYDEVFEIPPDVIAQNLQVELPKNLFANVTFYG
jgi:pyruvate-ferredoxin/flavodoxin oxidoreductase